MSELNHSSKAIFLEILDIDCPEERAIYLENRCADDRKLRAEVLALLEHQGKMGGFLDGQMDDTLGTMDFSGGEYTALTIGPYTVREKIGEGGMGVVYVAEQTRP